MVCTEHYASPLLALSLPCRLKTKRLNWQIFKIFFLDKLRVFSWALFIGKISFYHFDWSKENRAVRHMLHSLHEFFRWTGLKYNFSEKWNWRRRFDDFPLRKERMFSEVAFSEVYMLLGNIYSFSFLGKRLM